MFVLIFFNYETKVASQKEATSSIRLLSVKFCAKSYYNISNEQV
jgi:hypothetical protein